MRSKYRIILLIIVTILILAQGNTLAANSFDIPSINIQFGDDAEGEPQNLALSLRILFLLTILTLVPAIIVLLTPFTRIVIVLSLLKRAVGVQKLPAQVMVGLAIFMTIYIMMPVWNQIDEEALQPYFKEEISEKIALEKGVIPLREFMFRQIREKDIALFVNLSKIERPKNRKGIPTYVLIPAFIISELRTAFQIGFMIYLPFIVIDMIVASTLMSMGMMMLPPVMISLPFKVLLFVLADGWYLIVKSLIETFN